MEHIGSILDKSRSPGNIPSQKITNKERHRGEKIIEEEHTLTKEERKEELRRRLNITSWDNTFENFKLVKGAGIALKAFKDLASGKFTWHMLLCYGSAGCGKSHLCEALSIELAKHNIVCRVDEWAEVVRGLKRAMHSEDKNAYDSRFEKFRKRDRLIIDDVGMGSTGSSWEWGELEDIVNYRYRQNLMTVITTNLDIKELPPRIVSRFRDALKGQLVFDSAEDYRPKKGVNDELSNR